MVNILCSQTKPFIMLTDLNLNHLIICLLVYMGTVTTLLLMAILKMKKIAYAPLASQAFGFDDERRPYFKAKILNQQIVTVDAKKQISLTLYLENTGSQTAYNTRAVWYDEDLNSSGWQSKPELQSYNPFSFGDLRNGREFKIELFCEVDNVIDPQGRDVFFAILQIELEYKQSNGETCLQVITWINFSNTYDFFEEGRVMRFFD